MNATITVEYGGQAVVIELQGSEVSETPQRDGSVHRYLGNASKDYIGEAVEKALLTIVPPVL